MPEARSCAARGIPWKASFQFTSAKSIGNTEMLCACLCSDGGCSMAIIARAGKFRPQSCMGGDARNGGRMQPASRSRTPGIWRNGRGCSFPGEGRARRRRRGQVLLPPPEITRGTASCSCRNSARLVMCLGGMGELRGSTALTTSPKTQSVDKSGPIHGGRGHPGARCYTSTRRTLFLSERHRYLCIFRVQEAGST